MRRRVNPTVLRGHAPSGPCDGRLPPPTSPVDGGDMRRRIPRFAARWRPVYNSSRGAAWARGSARVAANTLWHRVKSGWLIA